jgi:hypothetical protein
MHAFFKVWALARLLAWAVLDQRAGKRRPKPSAGEVEPRRTIRTKIAKQVGHLTIASLLDRWIQREGVKREDETLKLMLLLFMESGGFGLFVQGRGATGLLSKAKHENRVLGYVYRIVLFLCRCKKHIGDPARFDIETAKRRSCPRTRNANSCRPIACPCTPMGPQSTSPPSSATTGYGRRARTGRSHFAAYKCLPTARDISSSRQVASPTTEPRRRRPHADAKTDRRPEGVGRSGARFAFRRPPASR